VVIGQSTFIGSCSCVTEGIKVGDGAMIGVGTIVTRNLDNGVFVLGNPMRQISKVDINL
jgi:serine O-acetyltransferase